MPYNEILENAYLPSFRAVYVSYSIYRSIDPEVRKKLLKVLKKEDIVKRYVGNIENDLRMRGEHELADALIGEIVLQRIQGHYPNPKR